MTTLVSHFFRRMMTRGRVIGLVALSSVAALVIWLSAGSECCTGSAPLRGSSNRRTWGSATRDEATLARWRMPFENVPRGRSAAWVRPTSSSISSALPSGSSTRASLAIVSTKRRAVSRSYIASSSGTRDISR